MSAKTPGLVSAVVVMLLLLLADHVGAGAPTERLRTFFHDANAIIERTDSEEALDESRAAVRVLVNDVFDFRGAAAVVLGQQWPARTPDEQDEFVRLFAELLERGFVARLGSSARVRGGLSIRFIGETVRGDVVTVATTMLTRGGDELPVDYLMVRRGERWAVRDALIDGMSLVDNYRAQFHRVMHGSSYGELVAQMRDKTGSPAPVAVATRRAPEAHRMLAASEPVALSTAASTVPSAEPIANVPRAGRLVPAATSAAASPIDSRPAASSPPPTLPEPRRPAAPAATSATRPPSAPPVVRGAPPAADTGAVAGAATPRPARYWIQLGAFKTPDAADRLARELRPELTSVSIAPPRVTTLSADSLSRVRVGPFAGRAAAVATLKALHLKGHPGFVIGEARD